MHYYYITGTSSGIGKALAEKLLQDGENHITGISRTAVIEHANYQHIHLDLSDLDQAKTVRFNPNLNAESVVLINNSGMVAPVKPVGAADADLIVQNFNVNAIAPALLMNEFVKTYKDTPVNAMILNTSSGAGRHTVESWGPYCASKAALDMYTSVLADEQKAVSNYPVRAWSVAPGTVDTAMQNEIREVPEQDFNKVKTFISYKENNQLTSPDQVAAKYVEILKNPSKFNEVLMDVRKLF